MVALYGQLLQRRYSGKLDCEAEQSLGFMITGAQRMEMLLRDLLIYSQAGSDQEPPRPVNCLDVLSKVTFNLQTAIERNNAVLTWAKLPEVIGNAIKYRGIESPMICVTAERRDENWLFCVEDNGMGI